MSSTTDGPATVDGPPPPPGATTEVPSTGGATTAARPAHRNSRLIISIVLLVIPLVATPLFVVAAWARLQITDTDRYVKAVAPVADDAAVTQYIADQLAQAVENNVDVASLVGEQLPANLKPIASTIASAVNGFVAAAANRFTASPAFKAIWEDANRAAHAT